MNINKIKNYAVNTALVVISMYIALFLAEIFVEKSFDSRTRYQAIIDYNESGIETYPLVYPVNLLTENALIDGLLPFGTISKRNTVNCNENGYWATFNSDRYGFSNIDGNFDKPVDVMLIGDSFAQGACVKQESNIASLMSENYRNTISIATGSSGPLIELAMMTEYISTVKPKYVLWLYFEHNDLSNLDREFKYDSLTRYLSVDGYTQSLISKQELIDNYLKEYVRKAAIEEQQKAQKQPEDESSFKKRVSLVNIRGLIKNIFVKEEVAEKKKTVLPDAVIKDKLVKFEQVIIKAQKISEKNNAKFVFVYLPSWERYALGYESDQRLYENLDKDILNIVNKHGIDIINFDDSLSKSKDPLRYFPFKKRGHYNEKGYSLLSDYLSEQLN